MLGMGDINLAKLSVQLLLLSNVSQFPKTIFFFPLEGLTILILMGKFKLEKIVQLIGIFSSCKPHPADLPSGSTCSKCNNEKF